MDKKKYQIIIDVEETDQDIDVKIDNFTDKKKLDTALWLALMGVYNVPEKKLSYMRTIFDLSLYKLFKEQRDRNTTRKIMGKLQVEFEHS